MAATSFLVIFFLSHFALVFSAKEEDAHQQQHRPPFLCGNLGNISFPFFNTMVPKRVALCEVDWHTKTIKLKNESQRYMVDPIIQAEIISFQHQVLEHNLQHIKCNALKNLSLPNSLSISLPFIENTNTTFFKCNSRSEPTYKDYFREYDSYKCPDCSLFYSHPKHSVYKMDTLPQGCSVVQLPVKPHHQPLQLVTFTFNLSLQVSADCSDCPNKGGKCETDKLNKSQCANLKQGIATYPIHNLKTRIFYKYLITNYQGYRVFKDN